MSGITDPLLQVRALQELARKAPSAGAFETSMFWENEHGSAGVALSGTMCVVFLFDGRQEVESIYEAGEILKAIFADEIAVVRAYKEEAFVYCGLARTDDPTAAFNVPQNEELHNLDKPDIDYVVIATWSRGVHEETE